jgi:hypothetical protein
MKMGRFSGKISMEGDFRPRSDWTERSRPPGKSSHRGDTNSGENQRKRSFAAKSTMLELFRVSLAL